MRAFTNEVGWFIVAIRSEDEAAIRTAKKPAEAAIKDIRPATRHRFSSKIKICVVLDGLRSEDSIAELCRRKRIAAIVDYGWSNKFLEAGKKRLSGDKVRAATTYGVRDLRRETGGSKRSWLTSFWRTACSKSIIGGWKRQGIRYPACKKLGIIRLFEHSTCRCAAP